MLRNHHRRRRRRGQRRCLRRERRKQYFLGRQHQRIGTSLALQNSAPERRGRVQGKRRQLRRLRHSADLGHGGAGASGQCQPYGTTASFATWTSPRRSRWGGRQQHQPGALRHAVARPYSERDGRLRGSGRWRKHVQREHRRRTTTGVLTNTGGAGGAAGSGGARRPIATSTAALVSTQANATLGTGGAAAGRARSPS